MSTFDQLKKNRDAALAKLTSAAEQIANPAKSYSVDERIFNPGVDKAGNGFAVIRFLPAKAGEDLPFVRLWSHSFKGETTGRWYIENSLTTNGQPDYASEYNAVKWNSGNEKDKEGVRARKRHLSYYSNVLVVSDPANPENEGKIKIFRYGKKIFDIINEKLSPTFPGEVAINIFDIWAGADFKIKIRQVEGYRNYDKSEFAAPSEIFAGDEERQKELYDGLYSLAEFVSPDKFKSYDELKNKFLVVMGEGDSVVTNLSSVNTTTPAVLGKSLPELVKESVASTYEDTDSAGEDDDSSLSYFAKLAKQ